MFKYSYRCTMAYCVVRRISVHPDAQIGMKREKKIKFDMHIMGHVHDVYWMGCLPGV